MGPFDNVAVDTGSGHFTLSMQGGGNAQGTVRIRSLGYGFLNGGIEVWVARGNAREPTAFTGVRITGERISNALATK
jgi:hypothetical protein